MNAFIAESAYFGVVISLLSYEIGLFLRRKLKSALVNPLLISIALVMLALTALRVDYAAYYSGAKVLSWLLTPATVCLAVPLYEKLALLRRNLKAVILGITAGVAASLGSVFLLSKLFGLTHAQYVTLLPKSITTAMGLGVSEELGGAVSITAAAIIITGILGNALAELILRLFRIHHPVARGLAIGTSAHAIGTARAMELGETEGAMSSLAIAVAGLMTVVLASVFAQFI